MDLLADEPRRQAMGRAGRARVENELAWSHQAIRYRQVYDGLSEPGGPIPDTFATATA
jgi:glycosyltransferase involved in cell wall biosynthesis